MSGKEIAETLAPGFADEGQRRTVTEIGELIDRGVELAESGAAEDDKRQLLEEIRSRLAALAPAPAADAEFEDSGESALLLTADPVADYQATAEAFGSTGVRATARSSPLRTPNFPMSKFSKPSLSAADRSATR